MKCSVAIKNYKWKGRIDKATIIYIVKEIPVQAAEMPLLQWLSFQNILPVPDMVRRAFMNEAQKPK